MNASAVMACRAESAHFLGERRVAGDRSVRGSAHRPAVGGEFLVVAPAGWPRARVAAKYWRASVVWMSGRRGEPQKTR